MAHRDVPADAAWIAQAIVLAAFFVVWPIVRWAVGVLGIGR